MSVKRKLTGLAVIAASVLGFGGAALAADYNWTFQTSETAGEPGFVNKQKWAADVGTLSGGADCHRDPADWRGRAAYRYA